ncbi:LPD25 domain-containing protein (plasmid) [Clostridium perfringens]
MYNKKSNDERKAEIEEILKNMEEGIKNVFESDKYKTFLDFISKFHNYSVNNLVWLQSQKPDMRRVAGLKTWNQLGRKVNKGEKALKVLAPMKHKKIMEMEKIDKVTGKPVLDSNGKILKEKQLVEWISYRTVPVFDISQTNGKEIPTLIDELKGSVKNNEILMNSLKGVSKAKITFEDIKGGAKGYYSYTDNRISINNGMSEVQTLKTLIHELAHSRLHTMNDHKENNKKELEAESVAYIVTKHFDIDTSDYSFGYLASWSKDKELSDFKDCLKTIQKEADNLIVEVEAEIQKYLDIEKNIEIKEVDYFKIDEKADLNLDKREVNKDGVFKEPYITINFCEENFFKKNEVIEFKEANKRFGEAEQKIRELKEEANKDDGYYPYAKTKFQLHYAPEKVITLRYDIGDGASKNLVDFLNKELKSDRYIDLIKSINKIEEPKERKSVRDRLQTIKENKASIVNENKKNNKEIGRD